MKPSVDNKMRVDKWVFFPPLAIVLIFCYLISRDPKKAGDGLQVIFQFITNELAGFYMFYVLTVFFIAIYLIFSDLGRKKFGHDKPDFSTGTWLGMLFTCQAGLGVLTWTSIEFFYYLQKPAWGLPPFSKEAQAWAAVFPMFHWGFSAFAISAVFGVVFAYQFYCKKVLDVRPSTACQYLIGPANAKNWVGKSIDAFFVLGSFMAIATCIGINAPTLYGIVNQVFKTEIGIVAQSAIVLSFSVFMAVLLYTGLSKGIKIFSDIRVYVGFALLAFLLLVGPTSYIVNTFADSVGFLLQNFFRLSLNTDPYFQSHTPQDWTVFYWCWYIAMIFSAAIFLARVSKGRSVREYLVGTILSQTLGSWIFFAVFQNYSMHIYELGTVPIAEIMAAKGQGEAIAAIWSQIPFISYLLPVIMVYAYMCIQTLLNGQVYTIAMVTTKNLSGFAEPPSWIKIFWAFALGIAVIALLLIGGIRPFQTVTIIGSLPLVVIATLVLASFFMEIKRHGWVIRDEISSLTSAVVEPGVKANEEDHTGVKDE